MLVFGIDVPIVEILFVLVIVIFFLLIESVVIVILLLKQVNKSKKLASSVEKLSEAIVMVKKEEINKMKEIRK